MKIGKRIKQLREKLHMTQEELAAYAGTTKQTIYKYEMGIITNIPSNRIEAISSALHVTPAYLMGWDTLIEDKKTAPPENLEEAVDEMNVLIEKLSLLSDEELDLLEQYVDKLLASRDK